MNKRRIVCLVLAVVLALSVLIVPLQGLAAEDTPALADPSFESDLWSGSPWSISFPAGEDWGTKKVNHNSYSSDSYLTVPENGGEKFVNVYMADGGNLYLTQELTNVPAGTYTLTALSMGADGETVAAVIGDQVGTAVQTNAGYNNWTASSVTATVDASEKLTVGLLVTCSAGGWCDIDCLTLIKEEPDTPVEMTELTLPNGDFELGNTENWEVGSYAIASPNQWASNNTTTTLNLWLSDEAEAAGSAAYAVTLTAGTYHFTFDLSGGITGGETPADSGLTYAVTAGENTLASCDGTYSVNGWDVWSTYATDDFTLAEETEVIFTLSGNQPVKFFGNLDNLKLYGTGSIVT